MSSGLNRLERTADLGDDRGRNQLDETLDLIANAIRVTREELDLVKDADRIVRPTPIREFPVAAGQLTGGAGGVEVGQIIWTGYAAPAPAGTFYCDGTALDPAVYPDLFAAIGTVFNTGGEPPGFFRIPDLRGRAMVGLGTGTGGGASAWTVGRQFGDERTGAHQHTLSAHTHDMDHDHQVLSADTAGGSRSIDGSLNSNGTTAGVDFVNRTSGPEQPAGVAKPNTGGPSVDATASGPNGTDGNVQPSLGMVPWIRYLAGPSTTLQSLPVAWGPVNGVWELDQLVNFPVSSVSNLDLLVTIDGLPEPIVRVEATAGSQAGNTTALQIIGVSRLPFNFREWRANAFRIRTKVLSTGIGGGGSATVTLRVSDPVTAGGFIPTTYSRVISEVAGTIDDGGYVTAQLTAEDLGRDWKPGYMFRFELEISHPQTFTTATLDVGLLQLNWR